MMRPSWFNLCNHLKFPPSALFLPNPFKSFHRTAQNKLLPIERNCFSAQFSLFFSSHRYFTSKHSSDAGEATIIASDGELMSNKEITSSNPVPNLTHNNNSSSSANLNNPTSGVLLDSSFSSDSDGRIHCIEIDNSGAQYSNDISRHDLAVRFGLHPRDLRFLESSLRNLPSILTRKRVIIVNLELFKAIISADSVIIFDQW
jgi:hypothetical protein